MNKKEIKEKVSDLIFSGMPKSEVFTKLSGQGIKDSQLAFFVASHKDPRLCEEHERKVNIIIMLMFIQAAIAFLMGFGIGVKVGPNAKWIFGVLFAFIPLVFAWGFYKYVAGAYNAYILLSIIQLPRQLEGFASSPIATAIGLTIGIGITAYVWYVRGKLFPDFAFIAPKRIKGQYVFTG